MFLPQVMETNAAGNFLGDGEGRYYVSRRIARPAACHLEGANLQPPIHSPIKWRVGNYQVYSLRVHARRTGRLPISYNVLGLKFKYGI